MHRPAIFSAAVLAPLLLGSTPVRAHEAPPTGGAGRMVMSMVVAQPLRAAWDLFTTERGIESWMVPAAEVDWRLGGTIRTSYDPEVGVGGPGTITHHILSYQPLRMYSTRFEAPAEAPPAAHTAEATWSVVHFEPVGPDRTRVEFVSLGWGDGPDWEESRAFFEEGNAWTFRQLEKVAPGSSGPLSAEREADRILELLEGMAGGEWIAETRGPQGVLRVRNVVETMPPGEGITVRGWLGGETGMFLHGVTTIARDSSTGAVRFHNLDQRGAVAAGGIFLDGKDTLVWEWRARNPDEGEEELHWVNMSFDGPDGYRMEMATPTEDGGWRKPPGMDFHRVDRAPARFHRIRGEAPDPAHGRSDDPGAETMEWLYRIRPSRLAMLAEGPTPEEAEAIERHVAYLRGLTDHGTLILAGRTQDTGPRSFGIVVFRAADEAEARRIMESDPAVAAGVMLARLHPYRVAFREPPAAR